MQSRGGVAENVRSTQHKHFHPYTHKNGSRAQERHPLDKQKIARNPFILSWVVVERVYVCVLVGGTRNAFECVSQ